MRWRICIISKGPGPGRQHRRRACKLSSAPRRPLDIGHSGDCRHDVPLGKDGGARRQCFGRWCERHPRRVIATGPDRHPYSPCRCRLVGRQWAGNGQSSCVSNARFRFQHRDRGKGLCGRGPGSHHARDARLARRGPAARRENCRQNRRKTSALKEPMHGCSAGPAAWRSRECPMSFPRLWKRQKASPMWF